MVKCLQIIYTARNIRNAIATTTLNKRPFNRDIQSDSHLAIANIHRNAAIINCRYYYSVISSAPEWCYPLNEFDGYCFVPWDYLVFCSYHRVVAWSARISMWFRFSSVLMTGGKKRRKLDHKIVVHLASLLCAGMSPSLTICWVLYVILIISPSSSTAEAAVAGVNPIHHNQQQQQISCGIFFF